MKNIIDIDSSFSLQLYYLGISSVLNDIAFVTQLNQAMDQEFGYSSTHRITNSDTDEPFFMFMSKDFGAEDKRALVVNCRTSNSLLIPKYPHLDYLLVSSYDLSLARKQINALESVTMTFEIDLKYLKKIQKQLLDIFL